MSNSITLYQYLHCPYCIRVRLVLDYLNIPYNSVLLPYADEATPIKFTGKKMAPIIKKHDGTFMNESLDIIAYLDVDKKLELKTNDQANSQIFLLHWIDQISKPLFNLLMPYYLQGIEFSEEDRKYFQNKKEIKRGPFRELVKKRDQFSAEIDSYVQIMLPKLQPFFDGTKISLLDIILTSHLWGLYLAYNYRVNEKLHQYLSLVTEKCNFEYDRDWWTKK